MFSLLPFKAVDNNHIKGNIDKTDTVIKVRCIKTPRPDNLLKFFKYFIFSLLKLILLIFKQRKVQN